jgi:hypothetical protein
MPQMIKGKTAKNGTLVLFKTAETLGLLTLINLT